MVGRLLFAAQIGRLRDGCEELMSLAASLIRYTRGGTHDVAIDFGGIEEIACQ